jgi:hypothetical protein
MPARIMKKMVSEKEVWNTPSREVEMPAAARRHTREAAAL